METRTLERMLRQRTFQFTLWILGAMVVSYSVLQLLFYVVEMKGTFRAVSKWHEDQMPRIAQAVFLKNGEDLKAIVAESSRWGAENHFSLEIFIFDSRHRLLARGGQAPSSSLEFNDFPENRISYATGKIQMVRKVVLGDQLQGYLMVCAFYPVKGLFEPSLYLLVGCIAIFGILRIGVFLWVSTLRRSVVNPVGKIVEVISPQLDELGGLRPIPTDSDDYKFAPIEFINLIESYNRLVENIQKLREKENQFIVGAAKLEVATQVAHDIRSPLAALSLAIEDLPQLPGNQKEIFLGVMHRMSKIGEELLLNSKSTPTEVALRAVVPLIVEEKRVLFGKNTVITFSVPEIPDVRVWAGESDLKRAVSNVIDNAVESIEGKGEVSLKFTQAGGVLFLSVKDNGKGIPKEHFEKVWEPGFSSGKQKGNGLGLPFVKSVVESWGGRVALDSVVNKGTVISLQLRIVTSPN